MFSQGDHATYSNILIFMALFYFLAQYTTYWQPAFSTFHQISHLILLCNTIRNNKNILLCKQVNYGHTEISNIFPCFILVTSSFYTGEKWFQKCEYSDFFRIVGSVMDFWKIKQ